MEAVAQWQSACLWNKMLWVRAPPASLIFFNPFLKTVYNLSYKIDALDPMTYYYGNSGLFFIIGD